MSRWRICTGRWRSRWRRGTGRWRRWEQRRMKGRWRSKEKQVEERHWKVEKMGTDEEQGKVEEQGKGEEQGKVEERQEEVEEEQGTVEAPDLNELKHEHELIKKEVTTNKPLQHHNPIKTVEAEEKEAKETDVETVTKNKPSTKELEQEREKLEARLNSLKSDTKPKETVDAHKSWALADETLSEICFEGEEDKNVTFGELAIFENIKIKKDVSETMKEKYVLAIETTSGIIAQHEIDNIKFMIGDFDGSENDLTGDGSKTEKHTTKDTFETIPDIFQNSITEDKSEHKEHKFSSADLNPKTLKKGCYQCDSCEKKFKHKKHMKRHIVLNHTEYGVSQKEFVTMLQIQRKAMKRGRKEKILCTTCGDSFRSPSDLSRHNLTHTGENRARSAKSLKCEQCEIKFTRRPALDLHMVKEHRAEFPFKCNQCESGFVTNQFLKRHISVKHSDETPFSCEHCGQMFKLKERLVAHACQALKNLEMVGLAKDPRKSMCEQCGKELSCKLTLARHMETHSESRVLNWECPELCGKKYHTKLALSDHIAIVHNGLKKHACDTCGKGFGRKSSLIAHNRVHTGDLAFRCSFCDAGFKEKRNMLNHQAKKHL